MSINVILIAAGGERLTINAGLLRSKPHTVLGKFYSSAYRADCPVVDRHFVEFIQPKTLDGILDYYRTGLITIPENVSFEEMQKACDHLLIPFSYKTVKNWSTFLSIQADHSKDKLLPNLFENEVMPHLNKFSKRGRKSCKVYFIYKCYKEYKSPEIDVDEGKVSIYIDDSLLTILRSNDATFLCFLYKKGFMVAFQENDTYETVIAKLSW